MIARRLRGWSHLNAVILLGACGVALVIGAAWPLAGAALASFGMLLIATDDEWRPLALANAITLGRTVGVIAMAAAATLVPAWLVGIAAAAIAAIDGIDGWIARRTGTVSAWGAHLDMETDALHLLVLTVIAATSGRLGVWVIAMGALRYVYVLWAWLALASQRDEPRRLSARVAAQLAMFSMAGAFLLPRAVHLPAVIVAEIAIVLSFARSFAFQLMQRGR